MTSRFRKVLFTSTALALSMVPLLTHAAERFDHKVRQDFFAGFAGNTEALARAMKICEEVLAANPNHPEALVWHGAGLYFEAGKAIQGQDRAKAIELFQRGVKEMDQAVELAPDSVAVRIPRGAALLASTRHMSDSPMRAGLIAKGIGDYAHVYEMQKDSLDKLGEHPRGELLFGLAEGHSRAGNSGQAELFFRKIKADMPGTVYAKRSAKWLETKTLTTAETGCVGCHVAR